MEAEARYVECRATLRDPNDREVEVRGELPESVCELLKTNQRFAVVATGGYAVVFLAKNADEAAGFARMFDTLLSAMLSLRL